jgi:hypothetical protein
MGKHKHPDKEEYEKRPKEEYEKRPKEEYEKRPKEEYEKRPKEEYEKRPKEVHEKAPKDDSDEDIKKEAKKMYIKRDLVKSNVNEFSQNIAKFIEYSRVIKETTEKHRREMNTLKEEKSILEKYLIHYLDSLENENDLIQVGEDKLIKKTYQKKSPLNREAMKKSIVEDLVKMGRIKQTEGDEVIDLLFDSMESKRTVTEVTKIVHKPPRAKKET